MDRSTKNRRGAILRMIACVALLGAPGCGSTDDGTRSEGSAAPGTLQELVDAFCGTVRSCCQAGGFPPEPLANCESDYRTQREILPLVEKGTVVVNADAFAACVSAFRSARAGCTGGAVAPACANAFGGTIAEGSACERSDECLDSADPAVCLKVRPAGATDTPKMGVCTHAPRGRNGDPCFATCALGRNCGSTFSTDNPNPVLTLCYEEDGLFCQSVGIGGQCAPLPKPGDPCTSFDGCGPALYCPTSATCTTRSPAGVVCAEAGECASGLTCTSGACAPPPVATPKTCGGDYN